MRNGIRSGLVVLALLPAPAAPRPLTPPVPAGLCRAGERVLFQCAVGRKAVAVCAGRPGARTSVQYRFGRPGAVELAYPPRPGAGTLFHAETGYSGGGEAQIGFAHAGTRYTVYSRVVRTGFGADGLNRPLFTAGVLVERGGRRTDRRCTAPRDADLDMPTARTLLPEGRLVEHD